MLSADRADLGVAVSNSSGESRDAGMHEGRGEDWLPGWLPGAGRGDAGARFATLRKAGAEETIASQPPPL